MLICRLVYKQEVHCFCAEIAGIPCSCTESILNAYKVNMMFVLLETILQIPQFPATRPCFLRLSVQYTAETRFFMKPDEWECVFRHNRFWRFFLKTSLHQLAQFCTLPPSVGAFFVSFLHPLSHFCALPPSVGAFLYSFSISWRIFVPLLHPLAHFCALPPSVGAFLYPCSIRWRIFVPFLHPLANFENLPHPYRLSFYSVTWFTQTYTVLREYLNFLLYTD
jgi:hypothetical protein